MKQNVTATANLVASTIEIIYRLCARPQNEYNIYYIIMEGRDAARRRL